MIAVITSIGEPTTQLCHWALQRQGFQVFLVLDQTSLAEKLEAIYEMVDEDFLRVDADVIPNSNVKKLIKESPEAWWVQGRTFDWFSQDVMNGGVQVIRKVALPTLRANIGKFLTAERPESQMFRLDEFHDPRRCVTSDLVTGLHGYGQADIDRVKATKARRKQDWYDWELAERIGQL